MTPELSVIVPTYNNVDVLRRCVSSWQRHAPQAAIELLVVEDGCRDATVPYLDELLRTTWGAQHVRVFHEFDVHEQRCTNRGFAEARGGVFLVWQDDMFVARPWFVRELVNSFRANPDLGVLGLTRGLDCRPHVEPIAVWEDLIDWRRLPSTIGAPPLNWLRIQEVDFVIRPWAARREAIETVGPLDTAFALSEWDEADLCFRIRQSGWRVGTHGYERLGAYVHLGSSTLGRTSNAFYKARVLENGRLFHARWDDEISRSHDRARRTWWRRAPAAAWGATAARALRRSLELMRGRS
jgi:GT2 family glycosyltransferase